MNSKTIIAATFAIAGLAIAVSSPARADGSMLEKCHFGSSRALVEKCCTTWIRDNGKPLWMIEANVACHDAVSCRAPQRPIRTNAIALVPYPLPCQMNSVKVPDGSGPNIRVLRGNVIGRAFL
jgi:hypothetical protein